MKEQTKPFVSLLTLFMALVIFIQTNVLTIMIFELKGSTKQECQVVAKEEQEVSKTKEWQLKIPKINLVSTIEEGTTQEIINNGIGHFSNTPSLDGNVGLIAGCYGYKENDFANIEQLQQGDIIVYQYDGTEKKYQVTRNVVIDQKDWSYLSSTKENKLTLITGVLNEPEKRRCVQAEEMR